MQNNEVESKKKSQYKVSISDFQFVRMAFFYFSINQKLMFYQLHSHILRKKLQPKEALNSISLVEPMLSKCKSQNGLADKGNGQELSLGSVHQYIGQDPQRQPCWATNKSHAPRFEKKHYDIEEAQRILLQADEKEQRIMASKIIAETMFKNIYGEKLRKIEQEQRQKENVRPKDLINLSSLEVVMNEMEYNPRSQSIMLRKEELEKLRELGRKKTIRASFDSDTKMEAIFRLKNQYASLKGIIIPTKSQEYEYFLSFYSHPSNSQLQKITTSSSFFKTMVTDLKVKPKESSKQDEYFQKLKAYKNSSSIAKNCPSHFVQTDQQLVMENVMEMQPPVFLFLLNQLHFSKLRLVKLSHTHIAQELFLLLLDCLRMVTASSGRLQLLDLSSLIIQNRLRFTEKLSLLLREVSIRQLKLESLDLCTGQFNRIAYGLLQNQEIQDVSVRHNRIDILGVRNMEVLSKRLPRLRLLDVRNNDIPHYANLKDKSSTILFF